MRVVQLLVLLAAIVCVYGKTSDGYTINRAAKKSYKLVYQAEDWSKAKISCEMEDAMLAVPKTQEEFLFMQKMVRSMYLPYITGTTFRTILWLGINNLDDYRVWRSVDGENIKNSFHKWAKHNGMGISDSIEEPHCTGIDAINPGLRDWWCHQTLPYICEKVLDV